MLRARHPAAMFRPLFGGMAEWFKAHAWKACWGQPLAGSNPAPSARIPKMPDLFGYCVISSLSAFSCYINLVHRRNDDLAEPAQEARARAPAPAGAGVGRTGHRV